MPERVAPRAEKERAMACTDGGGEFGAQAEESWALAADWREDRLRERMMGGLGFEVKYIYYRRLSCQVGPGGLGLF